MDHALHLELQSARPTIHMAQVMAPATEQVTVPDTVLVTEQVMATAITAVPLDTYFAQFQAMECTV